MYARRELIAVSTRKIKFLAGKADVDYKVNVHKGGILLFTADKEQLEKGKRSKITLNTQLVPVDRILTVKINNEILEKAFVSGTSYIDQDDSGRIVLTITPRVDLNLLELDYICKILVESFQ